MWPSAGIAVHPSLCGFLRHVRVVQLAAYSGPYTGSFVPMLRAALLAASRRGWDTGLVVPPTTSAMAYSWHEEFSELSIPITFLAPGFRRGLPSAIAELVASTGPTVLHTHFTGFDIGAVLAASRRPDVSALWHIHSPQRSELTVRARNLVKYGLVGRGTFRLLCVAPDIAADVRDRGAPAGKVEFFPNGIDTQRFRPPDPAERAAARAAAGFAPDARVVLHFGWDWLRKGGDLFLGMLAHLRGQDPPVLGVSVGGGDQARDLAERLGLGDSVRVIEPASDARALYAAADIFASTSRAEGMPFAVAEALCSGLSVIASDLPGHRAVAGELAACRIGPLDPERMAGDVRELLARPQGVVELEAASARRSIVERLDLGAWAERLADLHAQAAGISR
jgi:glycosyltransferase involved in cell wall biosynthesis